jgi:hypothetical protein
MGQLSLPAWNTTPSGAPWYEFYIYDAPGPAEGGPDKTTTKNGDYIYGESSFLYQVQFSKDGNTWWSANAMYVNHTYTVQVTGTTGLAANDWVGRGNSFSVGAITPSITVGKVKTIVGPTNLPINITGN